MRHRGHLHTLCTALALGAAGLAPAAAQQMGAGANTFGMPGVIDTPNATSLPDGELMFTGAATRDGWRATLSFQALPRLTVSLRYASVDDLAWRAMMGTGLRDRSFDMHLRLLDEGPMLPAVAVGLRDFLGTGSYSSEYIVATRTLTPTLRASVGMGWGRLASHGGFSNPLGVVADRFKTRPTGFTGLGGRVEVGRLFHGDAALFASVEMQATPDLTLMAEYSSDSYPGEGLGLRRKTPFNFGFRYRVSDSTHITGQLIQGRNVAIGASFALNPRRAGPQGLRVNAPPPVLVRPPAPADHGYSTAWTTQRDVWHEALTEAWEPAFRENGLTLHALTLEDRRAILRISNQRHEVLSRAVGRAARIVTYGLPDSVEQIVIIPVVDGVSTAAVTLDRATLEATEFAPDGAQTLRSTARFEDALAQAGGGEYWQARPDSVPALQWSLAPYTHLSYFDPNAPVRADFGAQLELRYNLSEQLSASLDLRQRIVGNISSGSLGNPSPGYPRVRTNGALYSNSGPTIERATLDYMFRPAEALYARLSFGLLERMYAGASAELLWSPFDSPLALGIEVNALRQRAPQSLYGTNALSLTSWHVSGYYNFGDGFHAQVDLGRYLAGDSGGTLTVERAFANGIRVGAYATLTNMPFDVFGEGSFDKGILITIPVATILGTPTTQSHTTQLRSITRDGGARVNIANRLYPNIRDTRARALDRSWEAFWQ